PSDDGTASLAWVEGRCRGRAKPQPPARSVPRSGEESDGSDDQDGGGYGYDHAHRESAARKRQHLERDLASIEGDRFRLGLHVHPFLSPAFERTGLRRFGRTAGKATINCGKKMAAVQEPSWVMRQASCGERTLLSTRDP